MKYAIKYLSMVLVNAMMIMTFILAPIPVPGGSNISYAADTDDEQVEEDAGCEEDTNKDGTPGVYKAGCEFNDDLAKSSLKNHYPEGTKGIIEQFIGAVFALVGVTAFWKPVPSALIECPSHVGGKVTFPMISAGSLAYLLGEIAANNEFKEGSKIAVNKKFEAKKNEQYDRSATGEEKDESRKKAKENREDNNKQLDAYSSLETIYEHQISGLSKKIGFATAAEVAFIAAEAFEITDIVSNITAAETEIATAVFTNLTSVTALDAVGGQIALGSFGLCSPLTGAIFAYTKAINAYDILIKAQAAAEAVEVEVLTETQGATVLASVMPGGFLIAGGGGAAVSVGGHLTEVTTNTAIAAEHESSNISAKATRKAMIATIVSTSGLCITALAAKDTSSLGTTAAASLAITLEAIPLALETVAVIEGERLIPLICSGTQTIKNADLDTPIPVLSSIVNKVDALFPEADVVNYNSIKTDHKLFYVKNILHNFFHRIGMEKINKKAFESPSKRISQIAAHSQFTEHLVTEAMDRIQKTDFNLEFKKIEKKLLNQNGTNISDNLISLIESFKGELITNANAGGFSELLNIGVKVIVLYYFMGKTIRNNAFPKPKNRIITWAVMSIVNGAIISFDSKSKDEAKKRLNIVKEEKRRFAASNMIKTGLDKEKSSDDENRVVSKEETSTQGSTSDQVLGCAVPKGNDFAPALCPSVVPRSRFNIPIGQSQFSSNGSLLNNTAGLLSDVGYGASIGQQYSNPSLIEANISSLSNNRNGLIKMRDGLRKKLENHEKKKDSNRKQKLKRSTLSSITSKFKKLYTGDPSKTAVTNAMAAKMNSGKIPKFDLDKLKAQNKKNSKMGLINIPKFQMPTSSGTSDLDFDLDSGGGEIAVDDIGTDKSGKDEEDLGEFVVNSGEINENEHVNIFKLISNRYLNSYPVLLEEKKKRNQK